MSDPSNKNSLSKSNEITEGNNPNDDEEILKNGEEPINNKKDDLLEANNYKNKTDGSETIGIP